MSIFGTRQRAFRIFFLSVVTAGSLAVIPLTAQVAVPAVCSGTTVNPGANLANIVNTGSAGQTFCIHAGTYNLGSSSLRPKSNMTLRGDPVTVGVKGAISAPTKIVSTAQNGVVYFSSAATGVTFDSLDISGATGTSACKPQCGRGINGNGANGVFTVRLSRVHGNANSGADGFDNGTVFDRVEVDHNGSSDFVGCCAGGIKSANGYTVQDSYVHDNTGNGVWCDVGCSPGQFNVLRNIIETQTRDGVRAECQSVTSLIQNNTIKGNNTSAATGGHGGVAVVDSANVTVALNEFGGNRNAGIEFKEDNRIGGTGCGGNAVRLANDVARDNIMNGDSLIGCTKAGVTCTNNVARS